MNKESFLTKWSEKLFPHYREEFTADLDLLIPEADSIEKIEAFVLDWVQLWPPPSEMVRLGFPEKKALIEIGSINTKMKGFFKDFKKKTGKVVSFQEKCDFITKATKEYLNGFRTGRQNWKYIQKAHYFITKDGNSELAAQILTVKDKAPAAANTSHSGYKFA